MCWITILRISPDGRSQKLWSSQGMFPTPSEKKGLGISSTLQQTCVLENILIFFFPYYEEAFSCLCGERDLLFPVHNVSAYTQG